MGHSLQLHHLRDSMKNKNSKSWKSSTGQAISVERDTVLMFLVENPSSELGRGRKQVCFNLQRGMGGTREYCISSSGVLATLHLSGETIQSPFSPFNLLPSEKVEMNEIISA